MTTKHQPAGVRERILDAALQVLLASGIQRLTQVEVAQRAGVRQSHLTYYFSTRDALLEAVIERGVAGAASELRKVLGDGAKRSEKRLIESLAASIVGHAHMRMFVAMIVEADGDPNIRKMMRRGTEEMEAALAEALGGRNASDRARRILIALWGLGLYHFLMRPGSKTDPTRAYLAWLSGS